jgi:hypothetical protein
MEEQSLTASFARDFQMRVGFKAIKTRTFLLVAVLFLATGTAMPASGAGRFPDRMLGFWCKVSIPAPAPKGGLQGELPGKSREDGSFYRRGDHDDLGRVCEEQDTLRISRRGVQFGEFSARIRKIIARRDGSVLVKVKTPTADWLYDLEGRSEYLWVELAN